MGFRLTTGNELTHHESVEKTTPKVRVNHVLSANLFLIVEIIHQGERSLSFCLRQVHVIEMLPAVVTWRQIPRLAFSRVWTKQGGQKEHRQRTTASEASRIRSIICIYIAVLKQGKGNCCCLSRD